jgi:hypothetical protein
VIIRKSFTVQKRLDGKWNLNSGTVHMGNFESKAAAEDAIKLIINPIVYFYDENGDELKGNIK